MSAMRRGVILFATMGLVALACAGSAAAATTHLKRILTGLSGPVQVTSFKNDPRGRLYVVLRKGVIRVYENGHLRPQPFLNIRDLVGDTGGEQGLLSMAFGLSYAKSHYFYVDYTNNRGDTVVARIRSDGSTAIPSTRTVLFRVDQPADNHNGGQLQFGPDKRLYIGMGDGGGGCDTYHTAQDLSSRLGKLLALDVRTAGATPQIVAYGLRNPWRFSFDRETGELWIGDVGQGDREEVDYLSNPLPGLVNFGWNVWEGTLTGTCSPDDDTLDPSGTLTPPVAEYDHGSGCAITGGYVYRAARYPALQGTYFYGDFCSGNVWSLRASGGTVTSGPTLEPINVADLSSFGEGPSGGLYLVSLDGDVYYLTYS
jgi:glucose/arabinose dehydrogenase